MRRTPEGVLLLEEEAVRPWLADGSNKWTDRFLFENLSQLLLQMILN